MNDHAKGFQAIEHFFVLMLENRSFDHLFGYSGIPRVDLTGQEFCPYDPDLPMVNPIYVTDKALDPTSADPPHEFDDVCYQLTGRTTGGYAPASGLTMNGFAASARYGLIKGESQTKKNRMAARRGNGAYAMDCFRTNRAPGLRSLAKEFALCTNWFSSMPGPTWPNRFFVHAASSGGLNNSPSPLRAGAAVILSDAAFSFANGTIFDRFDQAKTGTWRIYHGDFFPQVLAIQSIVRRRMTLEIEHRLRPFKHFADDMSNPELKPNYVFIEPRYNILSDSRGATSQHPLGTISDGEKLIQRVYAAIRNSQIWEKSCLIITYDEHGGFYDRERPPDAIPPGDDSRNHQKAEFPGNFDFTMLGVRVPAVIISPWIDREQLDPTLYDHTSILRTLEDRFELRPLTKRDAAANSLQHLFSLDEPRQDAPAWPVDEDMDAEEQPADLPPEEDAEEDTFTLSGNQAGLIRIAATLNFVDRHRTSGFAQRAFNALLADRFPILATARAPVINSLADARNYVATIEQQFGQLGQIPVLDE